MGRSPMGSQKSVKAKANETERRLAQDLGGHRVPASGAVDGMKGDVTTKDFLIDSKETGSKSIIISATQLNKISKEAREVGKNPALQIQLGQVQLGTSRQWVMIPLRVFKELTEDDSSGQVSGTPILDRLHEVRGRLSERGP